MLFRSSAIELGHAMVRHELQARIRESLTLAQEAKLALAASPPPAVALGQPAGTDE